MSGSSGSSGTNKSRVTGLHSAVKPGNLHFFRHQVYLLHELRAQGHRTSICSQNEHGETPLHLAAQYGYLGMVEDLCHLQADLNAVECRGFTPLHLAAIIGHDNVVRTLCADGAEVNNKDTMLNEFTPLHFAAMNGHWDAIYDLLEYGANAQAMTSNGLTPMTILLQSICKDNSRDVFHSCFMILESAGLKLGTLDIQLLNTSPVKSLLKITGPCVIGVGSLKHQSRKVIRSLLRGKPYMVSVRETGLSVELQEYVCLLE